MQAKTTARAVVRIRLLVNEFSILKDRFAKCVVEVHVHGVAHDTHVARCAQPMHGGSETGTSCFTRGITCRDTRRPA